MGTMQRHKTSERFEQRLQNGIVNKPNKTTSFVRWLSGDTVSLAGLPIKEPRRAFFLCVVDYSNKIFYKIFLSAEALLFPVYIGNTPYGKRHISRTEPVLVHLGLKLTFTPIYVVQVPDQFDAFFNPKNASEKNAKNTTLPSISQLEKRTSSRAFNQCCVALNFGDNHYGNHLYSHRFKPLTEPCVR